MLHPTASWVQDITSIKQRLLNPLNGLPRRSDEMKCVLALSMVLRAGAVGAAGRTARCEDLVIPVAMPVEIQAATAGSHRIAPVGVQSLVLTEGGPTRFSASVFGEKATLVRSRIERQLTANLTRFGKLEGYPCSDVVLPSPSNLGGHHVSCD